MPFLKRTKKKIYIYIHQKLSCTRNYFNKQTLSNTKQKEHGLTHWIVFVFKTCAQSPEVLTVLLSFWSLFQHFSCNVNICVAFRENEQSAKSIFVLDSFWDPTSMTEFFNANAFLNNQDLTVLKCPKLVLAHLYSLSRWRDNSQQ